MFELHLSRVRIDVGRPPHAERGATREYLLHQAVADLFGNYSQRPYVWRERFVGVGMADVLVLSMVPPDREAGPRMPSHRRVREVFTKPFRPDLAVGQQLDFEIRVNATRVVTSTTGDDLMTVGERARKERRDVWDAVFATGHSDEVAMETVYADWLRRQLDGVAILGAVAVTERQGIWARRSVASPAITYVATTLIGDLTVTHPAALVARMAGGLGRARAFGCGLLCLARYGTRPRRAADGKG